MRARKLDKNLTAFGRLAHSLADPLIEIIDSQIHARIILRSVDPKRALSPLIYERPLPQALEEAAALIARAERGKELVAVHFFGRHKDEGSLYCSARVSFLLRSATDQSLSVASARYRARANQTDTGADHFLNWAARESISIGKDATGQWAWHSGRSKTPNDIVVKDWRLIARKHGDSQNESAGLARALRRFSSEVAAILEQRQAKMDERQRRRAGRAALTNVEYETARLEKLVLPEKIGNAMALGEQLRLQAELKMNSKASASGGSGAGQAPAKKAARL